MGIVTHIPAVPFTDLQNLVFSIQQRARSKVRHAHKACFAREEVGRAHMLIVNILAVYACKVSIENTFHGQSEILH